MVTRLSESIDRITNRIPSPGLSAEDHTKRAEEWDRQQREREARNFEERLRNSGLPLRMISATLDGFTTPTESHVATLSAVRSLISGFQTPGNPSARSAILYGPPGTGKTHLACALMRAVAPRFGIRYTTVSDLSREVRNTYHRSANKTELDVLEAHISPSLLTIDEIGVGMGSNHEQAMLHDVVAKRYDAMRPTILISNLDLAAIKAALGDRLVDRLRDDNGLVLLMAGESFRGTK